MNTSKLTSALAAITITVAAAALPTGAFAENWTAYARKFQISFPGYSGTTTLSGFPVLVRLSPELNGFDYSRCRLANGGDLRFADAGGNVIPHEIDTWNTSGESLVWVKVPSLTAATTITAYYGNPTPGAASAESVWDSGYVGVWHLGESATPLAESTGVTTPFATKVGTVGLGATGIAGGAVDFTGARDAADAARLVAADDDDLDGFNDFTIEFWTKSDTTVKFGRCILSKRYNGGANVAYLVGHESDGCVQVALGTTDGKSSQRFEYSSGLMPSANVWGHQAIVRDTSAGTRACYLDGVSKTTGGTYYGNTLHNSARPLWLGNCNTDGDNKGIYPFNGLIDELRISRVARSADWIKATHDTIANDGFTKYSGIADDWKSYSRKFSVTFGGYAGASPLSGFPVLVRIAEYNVGTGKGIQGFSYAHMVRANGGDLRFADAEGNLLAHEIETWNPSGESLVWVKVPTLSASTKITAYYGSAVPCPPSAESVWDSGFVGVWHLGESATPLAESTGVTKPFETSVGNAAFGAAGIAGGAVDFSTATNGTRLVAADDDDLDGFDSFTFEVWTKSDTTATSSGGKWILSKRWNGGANFAYALGHETPGKGRLPIGKTDGSGQGDLALSSEMLPVANAWAHQAYVRDTDAGKMHCYLDGVSKTPGGTYYGNTLHNSVRPLWLGNLNTSGDGAGAWPFNGLIDELRISRVARSADWIKATHDTIAAAGFATVSAARENTDATVVVFR